MAFIIPNEGEVQMLDWLKTNSLAAGTLQLYKNDITPAATHTFANRLLEIWDEEK